MATPSELEQTEGTANGSGGLPHAPEAAQTKSDTNGGLCCRSDLRKKQLHSAYLILSFVSLGMVVALHGPTFLDLLIIVDVDIDRGTILFTCGAVGYLVGSLLTGIIYDRFSKELTLFGSTFLTGLFTIAIPWCSSLPVMAIVSFLRGCTSGGLDTSGNAHIVRVWGKEVGSYMQALHFGFGFGGIISPFVAEPFLAVRPKDSLDSTYPTTSISQFNTFVTVPTFTDHNVTVSLVNSSRNSTDSWFGTDQTTNIYIPYLIIGLLTAASAFPFVAMHCDKISEERMSEKEESEQESSEDRHVPLTLPVKVTFMALMAAFYISYCCVEDTYAGFIMSFVVLHLDWTKNRGAQITSVFWISLSAGRLLAVGIAKLLTPWKMLFFDFLLLDIGFIILLIGVEKSEWFLWICTVIVAAAMASVFPTGMTWMDSRIFKFTGRMASFILICASTGTMANPILVGYLFELYTPMWFVYLLFIQTFFCTLVFIVCSLMVVWIHRKFKQSQTRRDNSSAPQPLGDTLVQETVNSTAC